MLEILAGISLLVLLFEIADEWHERRLSKNRLAAKRKRAPVLSGAWDTLRGRWVEF